MSKQATLFDVELDMVMAKRIPCTCRGDEPCEVCDGAGFAPVTRPSSSGHKMTVWIRRVPQKEK